MKNYGNMVMKYASSKAASKYKPIYANSLADYETVQLADLERFLAEDMVTPKHLDNQGHYDALIAGQRAQIEAEVARIKAQQPKDKAPKKVVVKEPVKEVVKEVGAKKATVKTTKIVAKKKVK